MLHYPGEGEAPLVDKPTYALLRRSRTMIRWSPCGLVDDRRARAIDRGRCEGGIHKSGHFFAPGPFGAWHARRAGNPKMPPMCAQRRSLFARWNNWERFGTVPGARERVGRTVEAPGRRWVGWTQTAGAARRGAQEERDRCQGRRRTARGEEERCLLSGRSLRGADRGSQEARDPGEVRKREREARPRYRVDPARIGSGARKVARAYPRPDSRP